VTLLQHAAKKLDLSNLRQTRCFRRASSGDDAMTIAQVAKKQKPGLRAGP
jgi:hypothetical protein